MTEKEALELMKKNIQNENLQKHCIATGIVMKYLAKELDEDQNKWYVAGLLHDVDYTQTADQPEKHSLVAAEILKKEGLPNDIVYAVKVHNEIHDLPRNSLLDKALYAADPLTGLVVAGALIKPEKSLNALNVEFLMNRFREKSFARGVNREQLETCTELGFSLEQFMKVGLEAMQSISKELGL